MSRLLTASACVVLSLACGSERADKGTSASSGQQDAAPGDGDGDHGDRADASADEHQTLEVWFEPPSAMVCPGKCVTLDARTVEAMSDDTYHWADDAGQHAATREVCPAETTTYAVNVKRPAQHAGEFGQAAREGQAEARVTVRDDCVDGQLPPEVVGEGCSYRIPVEIDPEENTGIVGLHGITKLDDHGNIHLAAELTGKAFLGGKRYGNDPYLVTRQNRDLLLARFDANCKLLSARIYQADEPLVSIEDMAVDHEGGLALLSRDQGHDFFWNERNHTHLVKLDAQGQLAWEQLGTGHLWHAGQALSFAPDGTLAVSGLQGPCAGPGECVAIYDAHGALRDSYAILPRFNVAHTIGVRFGKQGQLMIAGLSGADGLLFAGTEYPTGMPSAYVALVDEGEALDWLYTTPVDPEKIEVAIPGGRFLANGELLLTWFGYPLSNAVFGSTTFTWRVSPTGDTLHSHHVAISSGNGLGSQVAAMPDGTLVALTNLTYQEGVTSDELARPVRLRHYQIDGAILEEVDVSAGPESYPSMIHVHDSGAMAFGVVELAVYTEENSVYGRQAALVVHRHPGFGQAVSP